VNKSFPPSLLTDIDSLNQTMQGENYVPLHVLVKLVVLSFPAPLIDVRTFPTCCLEES
jgi:hypothetical protein